LGFASYAGLFVCATVLEAEYHFLAIVL